MSTRLPVLALLLTVMFVQTSVAQPSRVGNRMLRLGKGRLISALDLNNDGFLIPSELRLPEGVFLLADFNKDKLIGIREMGSLLREYGNYCLFMYRDKDNDGALAVSEAQSICTRPPRQELDTNKDGKVSWQEWWKLRILPKKVWAFRLEYAAMLLLFFQPYDLNNDGVLSQEESNAARIDGKIIDKNKDGKISIREMAILYNQALAPHKPWFWFLNKDLNLDGILTPSEWQATAQEKLAYDLTGDGQISIHDVYLSPGKLPAVRKTPVKKTSITSSPVTSSPIVKKVNEEPRPPRRRRKWLLLLPLPLIPLLYFLLRKSPPAEAQKVNNEAQISSDLRMAKTYLRRRRFEKAASHLQRIVSDVGPKREAARLMLIEAFLKSGNKDAAQSHLSQLTATDLPLADLYRLALTLEKQQAKKDALLLYNMVYARNVKYKDVSNRLKRLTEDDATLPGKAAGASDIMLNLPERYKDVELIGAGGMGQVYSVYDNLLRRRVALKVLQPALAGKEQVRKRFAREARAMARLNHSSILPIFDVSTAGYYFTMPLLEGTELDNFVALEPPLEERLRVALETTKALIHAHELGILHRDIKPSNIFISTEGTPYLMDFGLAKIEGDEALTATDEQLGTLLYMAPELFEGSLASEQSDIYSLGLSFYRLFSGKDLYGSSGGLAARLYDEAPQKPSVHNAELPEALDDLILRCIKRAPQDRFSTVKEILAALENLSEQRSQLAAHDKRQLLYASRVEELYRLALHRLKNLFSICCRYADEDEKMCSRFYNKRTQQKIGEIISPAFLDELTNLAEMARKDDLGTLGRALLSLSEHSSTLANLEQQYENVAKQSLNEQALLLKEHFKALTPPIKAVAKALELMEVPLDEIIDCAAAAAPNLKVKKEIKLGATIRTANPNEARTYLKEAFENLFQNAALAGAAECSVTIALSDNESHLIVLVTNDGPPIDEEVASQLFKKKISTRPDGTGTGLLACQERMAAMDGTISLEERRPVTFRITLWRGRVGTKAPTEEELG